MKGTENGFDFIYWYQPFIVWNCPMGGHWYKRKSHDPKTDPWETSASELCTSMQGLSNRFYLKDPDLWQPAE